MKAAIFLSVFLFITNAYAETMIDMLSRQAVESNSRPIANPTTQQSAPQPKKIESLKTEQLDGNCYSKCVENKSFSGGFCKSFCTYDQ